MSEERRTSASQHGVSSLRSALVLPAARSPWDDPQGRTYAVSGSPMRVTATLPLVIVAFLGLQLAILFNVQIVVALGGFALLSTAALFYPISSRHAEIAFNEGGVAFRSGDNTVSARWNQVKGIVDNSRLGPCLLLDTPTQSKPVIRTPGGMRAAEGMATIPLRLFGEGRFAIFYEVRDHAENQGLAGDRARVDRLISKPLIVYGMAVMVCATAVFCVTYVILN